MKIHPDLPRRKYNNHREDVRQPLQAALDQAWREIVGDYRGMIAHFDPQRMDDFRNIAHECRRTVVFPEGAYTCNGTLYVPPQVKLVNEGRILFRSGDWPGHRSVGSIPTEPWHRVEMESWDCDGQIAGIVKYGNVIITQGGKEYVLYDISSSFKGGCYTIADGALIVNYGMANNAKFKDLHMLGWGYKGLHKSYGLCFLPTIEGQRGRFGKLKKTYAGATDLIIRDCFFEHFKRGIYGVLGENPAVQNNNFGDTLHPVWCMNASNICFTGCYSRRKPDRDRLGVVFMGTFKGGVVDASGFSRYDRDFIIRGKGMVINSTTAAQPDSYSGWWRSQGRGILDGDIPKGKNVGGAWSRHEESDFQVVATKEI